MKRKYGYRKFKGVGLASAVIGFTLLSMNPIAYADTDIGAVNETASTTPQPSGRIIARGEDGVPWELYENGYLLFKPAAGKDVLQRGMWNSYKDRITSVNFSGKVYAPENSRALFLDFTKMTHFNGANFDTSRVTDMSFMFAANNPGHMTLTTMDVGNWDTSKVTTMRGMFYNVTKLTTLNVKDWKTGNVTDMRFMFGVSGSESVWETLDVSEWDTSKVTTMESMFQNATKLTTLNVAKWKTGQVTNMDDMFNNVSSLGVLNVSEWNTSNVTTMNAMFHNASSLTTLDVSKWNTEKVTNMHSMFQWASNLKSLNVSKWKTSQVSDMGYMFHGLRNITELDVSRWDTSNVTDMSSMFQDMSSVSILDVTNWKTGNVTDMNFMFSGANALTTLPVSNWNTDKVTNMRAMFQSVGNATTLNLSKWNMRNVTNASYMFANMTKLSELNISNMTLPSNTNTENMFSGARIITIHLPETRIPNHNTTDMPKAFAGYMDRWSRPDGKFQAYSWEELGTNWSSNMAGTWVRHDDSATLTLVGEPNQPIVIHDKRDIPRPSVPKKNYRWVGWSRTQSGAPDLIGEHTVLQPGEHLTLYPVWEKVDNVRTTTVTIPAKTTYEGDDTIDYGKRSEVPGEDGEKLITTTYDVEDYTGRLINPVEDNGRVTKSMKPKVVKIGTKTKTETTPIAPKKVYRKDTSRAYGQSDTTIQGTPGSIVKTTTYEFNKDEMTISSLTTTRTNPATDTVVNVAAADKIVDTPIAPNVRYEADTTRARGTQDERTEGTPGNRRTVTTYDVNPDNGDVTERPGTPTVTRQPGTTVVRVGAADKVEKSNSVARTTRTIKDPTKPIGYRNVDKEGSDGYTETITHYNVNPTDGTVTERTETRVVPPVEQVITEGALAYDLPTTGTADMTVTLAGLAGTLVVTKRKKNNSPQ